MRRFYKNKALAQSQLSLNSCNCYIVISTSAMVVFFCVMCYHAPLLHNMNYTIGLLLRSISFSKCICNTKGVIVYNHATDLRYDINCSLVEINKIYINLFYSLTFPRFCFCLFKHISCPRSKNKVNVKKKYIY